MADAKAITKYIRISPRKARLAADLIRGLPVGDAAVQLQYCQMRAGRLLKKTLDSAVANAETVGQMRREDLLVVEVRVDEGPRIKRSKPKNKGGSHPYMHKMSHFTVIVGNRS